jgi:L-seryl-tRNA(Ser) seleniumtransferase
MLSEGDSSPSLLSQIPAVEKILHALETGEALPPLPRPLVTELVRSEIAALRAIVRADPEKVDLNALQFEAVMGGLRSKLTSLHRSRIHPVINGTGVIIHTNLGRSPLSEAAVNAIAGVGSNYCNIELDLDTGERGKRGGFLERCLALLCEAEAATVVNNCASALILILKHLANGEKNEVIISRGELVEIGGGFRVPEIMEASGAKLREVGATNKTSLADYENAIGPKTGMLLKVHRSNFWMEGFVDEPSTEDLVELGKRHGLPVVEDLGSGAMISTEELAPIPHEPTAAEVLKRGVDLVCVSGDKLFGGPQAGIIAGSTELVAGLKKQPFFRALRCDKLILTGLQQTVCDYLDGSAAEPSAPRLPLARMLAADAEADLRPRAEALVKILAGHVEVSIGEGVARCGGGTMPKAEIPSVTLDLKPTNMSLRKLAAALRDSSPAVIGYVADDFLRIDLRTVFPGQDEMMAQILLAIFSKC